MKIFVGGITGSGKSTLAGKLIERGFRCMDDQYDEDLSYWADKATGKRVPEPIDFTRSLDWLLDRKVIERALGASASRHIFIFANAANQANFYPLFDTLRVLTADNETIRQRILTRANNSFGKKPSELNWVLKENQRLTDELLSAGAEVINTTRPVDQVAQDLLASLRKNDH